MTEYKKHCIAAFYANCSGTRHEGNPGHNAFGWVEYKRSTDCGRTWSEAKILPYSYHAFFNESFTISSISAVSTKDDEIVLFNEKIWIQTDGARNWSRLP